MAWGDSWGAFPWGEAWEGATRLERLVRTPSTIIDLILDWCERSYSVPPCQGGLVSNGDFETGDFTNWDQHSSSIDSSIVNNGSYSSKLSGVAETLGALTDPIIITDLSAVYKAVGYHNVTSVSAGQYQFLIIFYSDLAGTSIISSTDLKNWTSVTSGWERSETLIGEGQSITIPSNTASLRIGQYLSAATIATGYIDDVYFHNVNSMCYNTRFTCTAPANYLNVNGKVYKFHLNDSNNPIPGEIIRPYLIKFPKTSPVKIDPKRALNKNANVSLEFYDELDSDGGVDKYVSQRTVYPNVPGTFWKKLIARNPHYKDRICLIKEGFLGDAESDYTTRKFLIDGIDVSDKSKVKVMCKDIMKLASKTDVPRVSSMRTTQDPLSASELNIEFAINSGETLPSMPAVFNIGDELIRVSGIVVNTDGVTGTITATERGASVGQIETTAEEQKADSKIQPCFIAEEENAVDIMLRVLRDEIKYDNGAGGLLRESLFTEERDKYLLSFVFTGLIEKPTKANKILEELQGHTDSNIWWGEEEQVIKFKVSAPIINSATTLSDADDITKISVDYNEESRVSAIEVFYNKKTLGNQKKTQSYNSRAFDEDEESNSSDQYDTTITERVFSRWIRTELIARTLIHRKLRRFASPPAEIKLRVEIKDRAINGGDIVLLNSKHFQDIDGTPKLTNFEVLSKRKVKESLMEYEILDLKFDRLYGFIAPSGLGDWDDSDADQSYAYIGNSDNKLGAALVDGFYIF